MDLNNLSYIGHLGNFITDITKSDKASSTESYGKKSLYSNAFDFEGTGELLHSAGLMTIGNSDVASITRSIGSILEGAHNVKMLTFGLDTIFQVGQTGFLPNLESLGFLKYIDISSMMSGFKLPPLVRLPFAKKGTQR